MVRHVHPAQNLIIDTSGSVAAFSSSSGKAAADDPSLHDRRMADIPMHPLDDDRPRNADDGSPELQASQSRGLTISFEDTTITDEGYTNALGSPSPRSPPFGARKGRSMMQELAQSKSSGSSHEIESNPECYEDSSIIGEPSSAVHTSPRYERGESRWPFLQSTVDQLAQEQGEKSKPITASVRVGLQGNDIASAMDHTPLGFSGEAEGSQALSSEVFESPSTSSFPSLADSFILQGPRSLENQRNRGGRPAASSLRRLSQRTSGRSGSGSAKSPASQFLSRYSRDPSTVRAELDDDGQAIGDQNEYVIGKQVGFGGFSVVKEVHCFEDGQRVVRAVKIVRKQVIGRSEEENEKLQMDFDHEVSIWRHLRHENILPLLSVFDTAFATFCIIPMARDGTLFDLVRARRNAVRDGQHEHSLTVVPNSPSVADAAIPVSHVQHYLQQLASALRYLHEDMRIVHRDIKLENCLVVNLGRTTNDGIPGDIKLCDFGMADFIIRDDDISHQEDVFSNTYGGYLEQFIEGDEPHNIGPAGTSTNFAGSLQYASPELIKAKDSLLIAAVDIWAFGVLAYALLTARLPFQHEFPPKLISIILAGAWDAQTLHTAAGKAPPDLVRPESIIELVSKCLDKDVSKRWAIHEVRVCRFLCNR